MRKRLLTTTLVVLFSMLAVLTALPISTSAQGENQTLSCGQNEINIPGPRIPSDYSKFGVEGSKEKIVEVSVPTELQGKNVTASAEITNALSVRSGSDITIESGSTGFTLFDVESAVDKVTTESGPLTLSSTVDVVLTYGVGGVFSGGGVLTINIDCSSAQPLVCGANTVQIPETVVRGNSGDTTKLASLTVPLSLLGQTVSANAQTTNNTSVHPGTQLIVSSNSTSFTLDDIEGTPNKVTTGSGNLTLGSTVDVSVKLGPDGVFSGGGSVTLTVDCPTTPPVIPPITPPTPPVTPPGGQGGQVLGAQVKVAPTVVNAGAGANHQSSPAAVLGLTGSVAALGLGLRRLGKDSL